MGTIQDGFPTPELFCTMKQVCSLLPIPHEELGSTLPVILTHLELHASFPGQGSREEQEERVGMDSISLPAWPKLWPDLWWFLSCLSQLDLLELPQDSASKPPSVS